MHGHNTQRHNQTHLRHGMPLKVRQLEGRRDRRGCCCWVVCGWPRRTATSQDKASQTKPRENKTKHKNKDNERTEGAFGELCEVDAGGGDDADGHASIERRVVLVPQQGPLPDAVARRQQPDALSPLRLHAAQTQALA
eukprot:3500067-Rhodomonas_salina.4